MSGRHRKPTRSSFGVAKIAVTGAVIGGGSVGMAAQAQAATDAEWEIVAACESSGNWSINTGNGYHGGLQFAPSTWSGFGGGQFAPAAHMATREEQIIIAEKVLAGQGKGAWPVCGRGLSGPTPRSVATVKSEAPAETPDEAPVVPLDNSEVPLVPEDTPAPQDVAAAPPAAEAVPAPAAPPAPAPEAPTPAAPPAPAPVPEAPAPAPVEAPAPAPLPAPEDLPAPAPQPEVIEIIEIAQTDPAVPTTPVPAPADPAAAAAPGETVVAAGQLQEGVQHLPSPDSPPPGTTTDPGAPPTNPNVSYLKDLWHALQNDQIDRDELLLALAQRSFTGQIPAATPAPAPAPGPVPAPVPAPPAG